MHDTSFAAVRKPTSIVSCTLLTGHATKAIFFSTTFVACQSIVLGGSVICCHHSKDTLVLLTLHVLRTGIFSCDYGSTESISIPLTIRDVVFPGIFPSPNLQSPHRLRQLVLIALRMSLLRKFLQELKIEKPETVVLSSTDEGQQVKLQIQNDTSHGRYKEKDKGKLGWHNWFASHWPVKFGTC